MILKSSYPIQLLILALGENSFAFPRKLRSLGELHSLTRKKRHTNDNDDNTGSITGGGGRQEVQTPCPLSLAFPTLSLQLNFIVTIIPYSRRLKFSDFYTLSQTKVLENYTFHSSSNCISVAQMWQLVPSLQSLGGYTLRQKIVSKPSCTLYVCYCLTCNAVPPTSVSPAMHSHC